MENHTQYSITMSGFTLIEVLLVNVILVILLSTTYLFWHVVLQNYDFTMTQFRLTEDADLAIRRVETELRQTQEAMQGAYPLAIVEDNQLAFYADADNDGKVERLRYFVQNNNLMRGVVLPTGNPPQYDLTSEKNIIIVRHLITTAGPLFTYYNGSWPGDTVNNPLPLAKRPAATRAIKIFIPIELSYSNRIASQSAQMTVQLRNLNINL